MATSGSIDFTLTASQIIDKAYRILGIKVPGSSISSLQYNEALETLNLMIKSWMAKGIKLWTYDEGVLFLDVGKKDYLLGGSSGDEATTLDDFINTTLSTSEGASSTVIGVTSSAGMTANDYVGIELDDGTRHWTTISTVDSSTQITIASGLASAAASGNTVFTYTSYIERPIRITSSRRKLIQVNNDNEIMMYPWAREEYFNQPDKSSEGTPINWYYSPLLDDGRYYVWQTASNVNYIVRFTFARTLEDVDVTSDNVDFPQEWLESLVYNLATRLGVENGNVSDDPTRFQFIVARAQELLEDAQDWDVEDVSLTLQPDLRH